VFFIDCVDINCIAIAILFKFERFYEHGAMYVLRVENSPHVLQIIEINHLCLSLPLSMFCK